MGKTINKTGKLRISQQQFIDRANKKHNNKYDYKLAVYTGIWNKVTIICPIHGEFLQVANDHIIAGCGCSKCSMTEMGLARSTTLDDFIVRASKIHNNKYSYDLVNLNGQRNPITIICPIHGKFTQIARTHLDGSGCMQCKHIANGDKKRFTLEDFILKSKSIWGDRFDYSKSDYIGSRIKLLIKCKKHNTEFKQSPSGHYRSIGCKLCFKKSRGEQAITEWLNLKKINYESEKRFVECRRFESKSSALRFDFYLPDFNLLIEFDGRQHYTRSTGWWNNSSGVDEFEIIKQRDLFKTNWAKDNGYKLLRIPYFEFKNINSILDLEIINGNS